MYSTLLKNNVNSGLLEDQVRLKDEEIRNKMTKRPITPPPSHSHMMPAEPLPEIIPPKQEFRQDVVLPRPEMSQPNPIREPVPKVGQYKQNNDNVLIMIIRFEKLKLLKMNRFYMILISRKNQPTSLLFVQTFRLLTRKKSQKPIFTVNIVKNGEK